MYCCRGCPAILVNYCSLNLYKSVVVYKPGDFLTVIAINQRGGQVLVLEVKDLVHDVLFGAPLRDKSNAAGASYDWQCECDSVARWFWRIMAPGDLAMCLLQKVLVCFTGEQRAGVPVRAAA